MFCLSYECFSILCNAFLLKSAISSHNTCVYNINSSVNLLEYEKIGPEIKKLQNRTEDDIVIE